MLFRPARAQKPAKPVSPDECAATTEGEVTAPSRAEPSGPIPDEKISWPRQPWHGLGKAVVGAWNWRDTATRCFAGLQRLAQDFLAGGRSARSDLASATPLGRCHGLGQSFTSEASLRKATESHGGLGALELQVDDALETLNASVLAFSADWATTSQGCKRIGNCWS